jgi:hypothetical protein
MWFSFSLGFLGLLESTIGGAPIDPQTAGFISMGIGFVSAILRRLTSQPIG